MTPGSGTSARCVPSGRTIVASPRWVLGRYASCDPSGDHAGAVDEVAAASSVRVARVDPSIIRSPVPAGPNAAISAPVGDQAALETPVRNVDRRPAATSYSSKSLWSPRMLTNATCAPSGDHVGDENTSPGPAGTSNRAGKVNPAVSEIRSTNRPSAVANAICPPSGRIAAAVTAPACLSGIQAWPPM